MKCFVVIFIVLGVILLTCDPTRGSPLLRVRRQGWNWGDESDERPIRPTRPARPSTERPTQPQATPSTNGNQSPDPNASGTTTISPLALRSCMSNCPTTQQYNPVCGSNRVTYDNLNKLNCAKSCSVDVDLLFNGTCQPVTR